MLRAGANFLMLTCIFACIPMRSSVSHREIRIGGIFDSESTELELAFRLAVDKFNANRSNDGIHVTPLTSRADRGHTLTISREICRFLSSQIVGIFGPSYEDSSYYVQSVCDNKEMPHVETHWDKHLTRSNCLVNLHPHPESLKNVYVELVDHFQWKKFTIIYENEESLTRISKLLTMLKSKEPISLRQIDPQSQGNYRVLLQKIKQTDATNFILDCSIDILDDFLRQAQQVSLVTERQSYIITNLDLHTIDLAQYQYSGCNMTGVRLVNPERPEIVRVAGELLDVRTKNGFVIDENYFLSAHTYAWKIRLETFLLMDSVQIFLETLKDLSLTRSIEGKQLYCDRKDSWEHGYSLINLMKTKNARGLSGMIKFDTQGFRSDYVLDVVELTEGGINKIGTWNSSEGLNITRPRSETASVQPIEGGLRDKSFKVLLALTAPYAMLKATPTKLTGNDRFEGFGVDLIKELAAMLGFNYTFVVQEDGNYGSYDRATKSWNGLMGEIISGRADLGICDLTITSERLRDVDFTNPFMNLGISILYRKPEPMPPSLFTFASPFSPTVWILLGITYFFVSLCFFIIGRLCPSEWDNPYPCVDEPDYLINQFTLRNSLWFTIGSLMQQGSEIAPIGISTRMASGAWWFFTLIMVSSYTANLAAFLTIETLVTPFKNIDELARQKEVLYGAKKGGATYNFFRDSNISTYRRIYETMYNHPEVLTASNDEGVLRVENENYAFIMESTTIEYVVERHCSLAQVGTLLDDKGYGIAMKKNATYRDILSAAVVRLQESGTLSVFKIKWWKEDRGGGNCEERATVATALDLKNLGGVFFVLVVGTLLGVLSSFLEMALHVYRRSKRYKNGFRHEVIHQEVLRKCSF